MTETTDVAPDGLPTQFTKTSKSTRLGWKSRCREMQAVRWGKRAKSQSEKEDGRPSFVDGTPYNAEFERYYKDQKICKEGEWDLFMELSKKLLPVSFRLNTSAFLWRQARAKLKDLCDSEELGLDPCLDHCPDYLKGEPDYHLFYQMRTDRSSLRKNDKFAQFHQFLMTEDNRGSLSRQETVSMLPVLFLDPNVDENILDLCAAPGMKFLQIVDIVESRLKARKLDSLKNKGIIFGNDISQSRVSTLAHHLKTMVSPSTVVTNYDSTRFPNLYNRHGEQILFDKILADMPCSCDGTMRKSMDIWTSWKASNGLHLHKMQLSILKRAIELLRPGGVLVYSTCSLNPLENEAIANFCVCSDQVELLDLEPLPGFTFQTGLTDWLVPDLQGGYYTDFTEVDPTLRERIKETMFKNDKWTSEEAKKVIRVLPHQNNTGGFFIFKIRKLGPESVESLGLIEVEEPDERRLERKKIRGAKLLHEYAPFYGNEHHQIMDFYGISAKLNFLVKLSSDRSVHLASDSDSFRAYKRNKTSKFEPCKYASLGARVFTKLETKEQLPCEFRITQEGSQVLHNYVTKRKLVGNLVFLRALLEPNFTAKEVKDHESMGNVLLFEAKGDDGNLVNGPLLIVAVLDEKFQGPHYESLEFITLAAVAIKGKLHLYIKGEVFKSLKSLI